MNDNDRFDIFDQALEVGLRARSNMGTTNATRWVRCAGNGCQLHAGHLDGYARTADGQLIVEHQGDNMNPLQRMRLAESPLKATRYDGDTDRREPKEPPRPGDRNYLPPELAGRAPHGNPTDVAYVQNAKARADSRELDRLIGQLHATSQRLDDLLAAYGPARPANDLDRRQVAEDNLRPEPGCTSCQRVARWSPIHTHGLCQSCAGWERDFGETPPVDYIEALERGDQTTTRRLKSEAARRSGAA